MAISFKSKSLKCLSQFGAGDTLIQVLELNGVQIDSKEFANNNKVVLHWGTHTFTFPLSGSKAHGLVPWLEEIVYKTYPPSKQAPASSPANLVVSGVIPLVDAKGMYQRVNGTSQGAVYVVVAMADNLNVAAKIIGGELSVRAEGSGLGNTIIRSKLESQGMKYKEKNTPTGKIKYMSGHYPCTGDAPPQKVLGAILFGSGIEFKTPMPKVSEVEKGCAA